MHSAQNLLRHALQDAARMRIYTSSRRVGRPIQELHNAWEIWLGDIHQNRETGGTALIARTPTLGDAAPMLFEQEVLFDDGLSKSDTVFDLLADVLADVVSEDRNSPLFDLGMLDTLSSYDKVRKTGLGEIRFEPRNRPVRQSKVDQNVTSLARKLRAETPPIQKARIMGKLNSVYFGDLAFGLQLLNGRFLKGAWMHDIPEPLRCLWGQEVLIEGHLQYKPNGEVLSLEAEAIAQAISRDRFWSHLPTPTSVQTRKLPRQILKQRKNPWELVIGIWPGGESDDEFAQMLEEAS